jgi:hypothetical protein
MRMEVEQREDEERGDDRHEDAADRAPHVACRDVPPPAVAEAEGDEDGSMTPTTRTITSHSRYRS